MTDIPSIEEVRRQMYVQDLRQLKEIRRSLQASGLYYLLTYEAEDALNDSIALVVDRLAAHG